MIERNGVRLGWIELISNNFVDRSPREKVDGQKEVETVLRDAQASRVTLLLGGGVKSKTRSNSQIRFKTRCQVSSHTSMSCQPTSFTNRSAPNISKNMAGSHERSHKTGIRKFEAGGQG